MQHLQSPFYQAATYVAVIACCALILFTACDDQDDTDPGDGDMESDLEQEAGFEDDDAESLADGDIEKDGDVADADGDIDEEPKIDGDEKENELDADIENEIDGDDPDGDWDDELDAESEIETCPVMWEGPAPPDCQIWDCSLEPWPDCWVCDIVADISQNGMPCSYCEGECDCTEQPCICLDGVCINDPSVDGDAEDSDREIDTDSELNTDTEDEEEIQNATERIVVAGDSWSCGIVAPTRNILDERGFSSIEITYSTTAVAGSTAVEWVNNHDNKLLKLSAALDQEPQAELLLLVIGGNDVNAAIYNDDFDDMSNEQRSQVLDGIRDNIRAIVDFARLNRPHLSIVLVGYDYFHYLFLQQFYGLGDMYLDEYNQTFVNLGLRKLEIANQVDGCYYAHNFGVLQYTFGDRPHPPYSLPLFEYPPGYVPAPGIAPDYTPFPGGLYQIPSPLDQIPDGIHPNEEGFTAIMNHVFDQGMENLLSGYDWVIP